VRAGQRCGGDWGAAPAPASACSIAFAEN